MTQTVKDIPRHLWHTYQPAAAMRMRREDTAVITTQRQKAWTLAQTAATLLYDQFSADRVVLFGSLASENDFTHWSDIDLAVWGIAPEDFYAAVAAVTSLSSDIKLDLVDPADCPPSLQTVIAQDGVDL